jgi:broad specificity phosphatase PhoE
VVQVTDQVQGQRTRRGATPGSGPAATVEEGFGVYLVRHGRTSLNAEHRIRGWQDPPLDAQGRREAAALGRHFGTVAIERIVCSPLERAHDTAAAIATHHGLAVVDQPALLDRDYGPWAGHLIADVVAQYGSVDRAPGVEPWHEFESRVRSAIDAELDRSGHGPLLVVVHDAVNRALLHAMCGLDTSTPQDTGCWNELRRAGDSWQPAAINHLP